VIRVKVSVPKRLQAKVKHSMKRALNALAMVAYDRVTALAQERLTTSAKDFIHAVSTPVVNDRSFVIKLNTRLAAMQEQGRKPFDMKVMLKGRKFVAVTLATAGEVHVTAVLFATVTLPPAEGGVVANATADAPVRYVPRRVSDVPPAFGANVGAMFARVGAGGVNVNAAFAPPVPPTAVTSTRTAPVPAGVRHWIVWSSTTRMAAAPTPPKVTARFPASAVPEMTTSVPPASVPEFGVTLATVGAARTSPAIARRYILVFRRASQLRSIHSYNCRQPLQSYPHNAHGRWNPYPLLNSLA
jgi:hypothetical protein